MLILPLLKSGHFDHITVNRKPFVKYVIVYIKNIDTFKFSYLK